MNGIAKPIEFHAVAYKSSGDVDVIFYEKGNGILRIESNIHALRQLGAALASLPDPDFGSDEYKYMIEHTKLISEPPAPVEDPEPNPSPIDQMTDEERRANDRACADDDKFDAMRDDQLCGY